MPPHPQMWKPLDGTAVARMPRGMDPVEVMGSFVGGVGGYERGLNYRKPDSERSL